MVSIAVLRNTLQEYKVIPWDALKYMTGEIIFGGRVTDDWDRRCLISILSRFYSPSILDLTHKFSSSNQYKFPGDVDLLHARENIDKFPFTDTLEIFGMHENANISYQVSESRKLIKLVVDSQPRTMSSSERGANSESNEDRVIAMARGVLDSLPDFLDVDDISLNRFRPDLEKPKNVVMSELFELDAAGRFKNSISTVLMQESMRFNRLLATVRDCLQLLIKGLKGLVMMNAELEKVFLALLMNEVPSAWSHYAYLSLKPFSSWVRDLEMRVEFFRNWMEKGQPKSFWLSGFFFPQGEQSRRFD